MLFLSHSNGKKVTSILLLARYHTSYTASRVLYIAMTQERVYGV